ncbi:MAG: ABC transporter permease [Acetivibrionales bacterium]|jgi:simple sugar transport system permease protein
MPKKNAADNRIVFDAHILRLIVLFICINAIFGIITNGKIFKVSMIGSMLNQLPEYGIIALGIMITRISGGIDLSAVGVANLAAILSAKYMLAFMDMNAQGMNAFTSLLMAFLVAFGVGVLLGALNGYLICKLNLPAMVVTIGTGKLFTGIGIILTEGRTISKMPVSYYTLIQAKIGIVPIPILFYLACALLMVFLLYKTRFGLQLYLQGTNAVAARFSGISKRSILIRAYILSACMSVLGGMIMLGRFNSVNASNGSTYALLGVLICMMGGINPTGGLGRVEGVIISTFILQMISSGMSLFGGISTFYNQLIYGALLLLFMVFNYYINKNREYRLRMSLSKS